MFGAMDGKMLGLAVNGQFTPCELACSISGETEMLPTSSSVNGSYRSFRPGYKSWEISVDGRLLISSLPSSFNSLLDTWDASLPIPVAIQQRSSSGQPFALYGQAYIRNFSLNAANTGKANYTVQFQGTGELTRDIEVFWQIINAMPAPADYPLVIDMN